MNWPRHADRTFKGFCYIKWRTREYAQRCIGIFHSTPYMTKRLDIMISKKGEMKIYARHLGLANFVHPRIFEQVWHFPDENERFMSR